MFISDNPVYMLMISIGFLIIGVLLLKFREEIGGATGHFIAYRIVTTPTPGCFIIPFAIVLMLAGALGVIVSIFDL